MSIPSGTTRMSGTGRPTVSVVVPCLNEERNLPYVFARMPRDIDQVVLVDGGSIDGTVDRARRLWPSVAIVHQSRRGKGNALACGFAACTSDIIVMLDADGSTDPAEIPRFVQALVDGADFAKGSRFLPGGGSADITRLRRIGNNGLSGLVNVLFRTGYSDLCYGYNAFWRSVLPFMDLPHIGAPRRADGRLLWGDGFEVETLINIRVALARLIIAEVPSVEARRLHGASNLNAYSDGVRVLSIISREYRNRRSARSRALAALASSGSNTARQSVNPRPAVTSHAVLSGHANGTASVGNQIQTARAAARESYIVPRNGQAGMVVHSEAGRVDPSTAGAVAT